MHPLAAPGTLWVLSSDGKYLVRPQADETSHKKQTSCDRQEKGLPFFSRIAKGFASAEATRGLSDRPLDPFGAHPCMRGRNLPQETASLWQAGKGPTFPSRIAKDFASAEATRGLSDRPLDPFGAHPCMRGRNLPQETASLWQAGKGLTFLFCITKNFASAEATKGPVSYTHLTLPTNSLV